MYPQVTISPTTDFNFLEKFEEYEKIERNKMRQALAQSYLDTAHLGIHGLWRNVEKFSDFRSLLSLQGLHHPYLPPHLGQGLPYGTAPFAPRWATTKKGAPAGTDAP